jgi:hypothetical protein
MNQAIILTIILLILMYFQKSAEGFEVYKGEIKPFGYGYRPYRGYRPYLYDGYNVRNVGSGFVRPILSPTYNEDIIVPVGYDYWNNSRYNSTLPQYNPSEVMVGVNYYNMYGFY